MNRLQSIVVGVDFTPCSASALKQAIRIAEWNLAKLHVIHVVDTVVVICRERALNDFQRDIRAGVLRNARSEWSEFTTDIPEASGLELAIEVNNAEVTMMRCVRERKADLLVMGAHGTSRPDKGVGMLAAACVQKARAKVMLVRDSHSGPFRSVVACVDFSDTSRTALQQAVRVAVQDNATLHILHVFCGSRRLSHAVAPTQEGSTAVVEQHRGALLHRLEQFGESLREEMGHIEPLYELFDSSKYASGITAFAKQVNADLVVLGTRGQANLRDLFWGSTAERVVRDTPCSILAVKPPGLKQPLGRPTQ